MKPALAFGLASALLWNTPSYALDPVQGFYGGVFLGGNYTSPITFRLNNQTNHDLLANGKLAYSISFDGGGQVGYRMNQFRIESELLYNYSPFDTITINKQRFKSEKRGANFRYEGQTNTGALMVNGFFDAFFVGEESNIVPYVGLGLGYARVQNSIKFYCNNINVQRNTVILNPDKTCTLVSNPNGPDSNVKKTASAGAGQAILGVSYFMDDFTLFGLDVRQLTTRTIKEFDHKVQFTSLNLSFNGAFDFG